MVRRCEGLRVHYLCRGVEGACSPITAASLLRAWGFKSLPEGAKVSYEPREGQKGPEATEVSLVA